MQCIIHTPTNGLKNSLDFYTRLNFSVLSAENPAVVTDGKAIVEINPDRYARAGLKIYGSGWANKLPELEKTTAISALKNGYLLSDPGGVWIYLIEGKSNINYGIQESSFGITGNFSGLSLETGDISRSLAIYRTLGFSIAMGDVDKGWISLAAADGFIVSLMKPLQCPHLFFNPSMTYFNGKNNLAVIENIRRQNIPIAEEITHFNKDGIVDNIIIRDPGGYGFFIFND